MVTRLVLSQQEEAPFIGSAWIQSPGPSQQENADMCGKWSHTSAHTHTRENAHNGPTEQGRPEHQTGDGCGFPKPLSIVLLVVFS